MSGTVVGTGVGLVGVGLVGVGLVGVVLRSSRLHSDQITECSEINKR